MTATNTSTYLTPGLRPKSGFTFGVTCDSGDGEDAHVQWHDPIDGACLLLCEHCAPRRSRTIDWYLDNMTGVDT